MSNDRKTCICGECRYDYLWSLSTMLGVMMRDKKRKLALAAAEAQEQITEEPCSALAAHRARTAAYLLREFAAFLGDETVCPRCERLERECCRMQETMGAAISAAIEDGRREGKRLAETLSAARHKETG